MKVMLNLSSAPLREETPHSTNAPGYSSPAPRTTISDALKRRAQAIINDKSIDPHTRAIIRYGLEINDPDLPELIRCADNGESILDNVYVASSEEKIEALTNLICRAGEGCSAALLVLLSTVENSAHPKALANAAKHFAFTRCGELNLHGMVDAQIAMLEDKLFAHGTLPS
jgi:hypothetical protein